MKITHTGGHMKYYSYSPNPSPALRRSLKPRTDIVPRETVPKTINALDVLLSIWIAEAVLETESRRKRRPKAPAKPS
ncbi:MAG TPA: hypothetical protein VKV57_09450 [bacterium]|nr:hypothetical protein [bacterium]